MRICSPNRETDTWGNVWYWARDTSQTLTFQTYSSIVILHDLNLSFIKNIFTSVFLALSHGCCKIWICSLVFSHIAVNVSSRSHINFYSQTFLPRATMSVVLKKPKTKSITPVETTFLNLLLVISSCHYRILSFLILSYYSSCFGKYIDKCVRVALMLKKAHAATNKRFLALVVIWSTGVHEERSHRSHSWLRFVKMKLCWNKGVHRKKISMY